MIRRMTLKTLRMTATTTKALNTVLKKHYYSFQKKTRLFCQLNTIKKEQLLFFLSFFGLFSNVKLINRMNGKHLLSMWENDFFFSLVKKETKVKKQNFLRSFFSILLWADIQSFFHSFNIGWCKFWINRLLFSTKNLLKLLPLILLNLNFCSLFFFRSFLEAWRSICEVLILFFSFCCKEISSKTKVKTVVWHDRSVISQLSKNNVACYSGVGIEWESVRLK